MIEESDHDILIDIRRQVKTIKSALSNHLHHHWLITLTVAAALIGLLVTTVVAKLIG